MKLVFALGCLAACAWAQEGTGPFPALMEQGPGLPTHTIYRPKDLTQLKGQKLPIVAWGNGACMNNGASFRNYLLHSPIFYITGDKSDIAFENGMDDFKRITKVPAYHANKDGVQHGGTYNQPNGGEFGKVAVAMPQWQFKNDQEAAKMFIGANCGLCQDPQWHVSNKGLK